MIVDSKTSHNIFYFMYGYSDQNQIRINKEDQHKIYFFTPWGSFCWVFMPFRLNNTRVTYQRVMLSMFHDMNSDFVEFYVDDILTKFI